MEKETCDFMVDILQDFEEVESMLKVLKDCMNNENREINLIDIANAIKITLAKTHNANISLNRFAETIGV